MSQEEIRMGIAVNNAGDTFHLYNDEISYIMKILPNKQMGQIYFGKRIRIPDSFWNPSDRISGILQNGSPDWKVFTDLLQKMSNDFQLLTTPMPQKRWNPGQIFSKWTARILMRRKPICGNESSP